MLYIFWFLHQTTTVCRKRKECCRCISFDSYIKPQPNPYKYHHKWVVYLLIPTSNHNQILTNIIISELYIFWFLHQTTTTCCVQACTCCCISFDSYIKPQLLSWSLLRHYVVYLLIPTSNHNCINEYCAVAVLYIFWFLHQTTTCNMWSNTFWKLYIFWFLHQTTTTCCTTKNSLRLYIFWFLHQTTTDRPISSTTLQLYIFWFLHQTTTRSSYQVLRIRLYIFWFLHQTTTSKYIAINLYKLYIFWFLHQTTTEEL